MKAAVGSGVCSIGAHLSKHEAWATVSHGGRRMRQLRTPPSTCMGRRLWDSAVRAAVYSAAEVQNLRFSSLVMTEVLVWCSAPSSVMRRAAVV